MHTPAFADAGFAIPPRPAGARAVSFTPAARRTARAARGWVTGLGALQEASLLGILGLLAGWGLAELALWLQGF
ncbi:hypothetical protein [Paracraurococcus lichenis]|uniref:Uncharacterized protein n=1 Tax=Paracraurococcus lichenis TaxID=3064888 RepID=A0ABT9DSU3_9PROT|nr:hypothetical protein [Paracraurococcus sp. LOR1-02]MDO9706969.1 hypothetical protein [Paracraurococcus sp. LOR1-02]